MNFVSWLSVTKRKYFEISVIFSNFIREFSPIFSHFWAYYRTGKCSYLRGIYRFLQKPNRRKAGNPVSKIWLGLVPLKRFILKSLLYLQMLNWNLRPCMNRSSTDRVYSLYIDRWDSLFSCIFVANSPSGYTWAKFARLLIIFWNYIHRRSLNDSVKFYIYVSLPNFTLIISIYVNVFKSSVYVTRAEDLTPNTIELE